MEKASKGKLIKIVGILCAVGLVIKTALVVHSGKMYVLWYNSVLVVCVLMVLSIVGFWIYVAVKGLDNIFTHEIRGGEDLPDVSEIVQLYEEEPQ